MYMDDRKLSAKNEKELETLIQFERIYSQDIEMKFDIEKMRNASNEKRQTSNDERSRTANSSNKQNTRRKVNLHILRHLGSWHHKKRGNET